MAQLQVSVTEHASC